MIASLTSAASPMLAQAAPKATELAEILRQIDGGKVVVAVAIVATAYVLDRLIRRAVTTLEGELMRRRNQLRKAASLVRLGLFLAATYLAMSTLLEGQQQALMGVAGTLGLAAGFALKDTVGSLVAGVLILIDRPFKVGDRVEFGDHYGVIQKIGLRAVVLRTGGREWYSIPNNRFLSEVVVSANASTVEMMAAIKFYIGVGADFELARELVYRGCVTSRYACLDKPVDILVTEVALGGAYATVITCKAYVIDTSFENVYRTEVTRRVKRAFRKHRIPSPYAREYIVQTPEWEAEPDQSQPDQAPAAQTVEEAR
ncbi:MAG: mechanosensitive ion channel family protein [Persicimonas sp.]